MIQHTHHMQGYWVSQEFPYEYDKSKLQFSVHRNIFIIIHSTQYYSDEQASNQGELYHSYLQNLLWHTFCFRNGKSRTLFVWNTVHVTQHQYHGGGRTSTKIGCHLTYTWRHRLVIISGITTSGLLYHINVPLSLSEECKIERKTTLFLILHMFIIMTDSLQCNSVGHSLSIAWGILCIIIIIIIPNI